MRRERNGKYWCGWLLERDIETKWLLSFVRCPQMALGALKQSLFSAILNMIWIFFFFNKRINLENFTFHILHSSCLDGSSSLWFVVLSVVVFSFFFLFFYFILYANVVNIVNRRLSIFCLYVVS